MNVFIAGPRAISVLDKAVVERLNNIFANKHTVLVGDADGVDSSVQRFFSYLQYRNVVVFACEGKARNNIGSWEVRNIAVPPRLRGFKYYEVKDKAMSTDADYGFMIWNGESKGTLNNIINLVKQGKKTVVYHTKTQSFFNISSDSGLQDLISICGQKTQLLFSRLITPIVPNDLQQISLFNAR